MGEARHFPPNAQAKWVKDGKRAVERWEKPGNSHPIPRQGVKGGERVDKRWESSEKAHPMPRQSG